MQQLSIRNVSKSFSGARALAGVDLDLAGGKVHALMGENGAGKSTLIKILAGVVSADAMDLQKDGRALPLNSAQDASTAGFRFIHQELNVVPQLSVAENIFLARPYPQRFGIAIDWAALNRQAAAALARLGIDHIDTRLQAAQLTTGDQMLMKIAGSLVSENAGVADLYVFDEPTAALTGDESEKLFHVISELKNAGAAILYVSHRMNEVMRICDTVTVLRDGERIFTAPIAETSREDIIIAMTGRPIEDVYPPRQRDIGDSVVYAAVDASTPGAAHISFDIRAGEILGVAGLANTGQSEVLRLVMGLSDLGSGTLTFNGETAPCSPSQAWDRAIAYVPKERRSEGLMLQMGVRPNTVLPHLDMLSRFGLLASRSAERINASGASEKVRLKSAGLSQPVYQLSGGNQQKVVFARALGIVPALLVLDEPTRGVDIGAKYDIYTLVRELSDEGCPVIMTSTDLPEMLGMCDRILIMRDGVQHEIVEAGDLSPADLLRRFYASEAA